ncbi:cytochrome c1 [Marinomonas flavescens]|uniref:cytochrome c1 n=1 Tax=Marinomonas flavescens TaxID=2529379 RepID=UPI001055EC89|nr:cytochrome c1 [Marinomonas flavescens]
MSYLLSRVIVFFLLILSASAALSADVVHKKMTPNYDDKASLQRGLAIYSNYCSGCHQIKYVRYSRIADDLSIPKSLFEENLLPKYARMGDQITSTMTKADAKAWFGVIPPDLSLEAGRRSPDWVYRYLQSFYQDSSRPYGVNNALSPDSMMPNVLEHLQGERVLSCQGITKPSGNKYSALTNSSYSKCDIVDGVKKGQLTDQEFKQVAYDVANFLAYASDPSRSDRESLGLKVLLFLSVFVFVTYLLKKEFWRDIA